jgi:hypothetical protein
MHCSGVLIFWDGTGRPGVGMAVEVDFAPTGLGTMVRSDECAMAKLPLCLPLASEDVTAEHMRARPMSAVVIILGMNASVG